SHRSVEPKLLQQFLKPRIAAKIVPLRIRLQIPDQPNVVFTVSAFQQAERFFCPPCHSASLREIHRIRRLPSDNLQSLSPERCCAFLVEYTLKLGRSCGDRRRVFAIEFGRSCRHCERPIDLPLPQQRFAQKVEVLYMRFDGDCLVEPPNGLRISPGGKQGEAKEPDAR